LPSFQLQADNADYYLRERGLCGPFLNISELGGGVSNTVLLVETASNRIVLKQALAKLRVEQDWFSDRTRVFRESGAMKALAPHLPAGSIPEILFEDRDNCIFAMSAAPAESRTWKSLLMEGRGRPVIAQTVGRMLGTIVGISWHGATWERQFGDQTVFDQLRLDPFYRTTAAEHPDLQTRFDRLLAESAGRRVSVVHGDWSPKNFLVSEGSVMAIDFEVVHFGDPSFDSAFLLNHLLMKSFYLRQSRAYFSHLAREFWRSFMNALPAAIVESAGWMEQATLQHLGCLLLARIDGKSPAEYLQEPALRKSVRRFARDLILHPPATIAELFR
jgi:5-methylthioribose kinase